jgi:uncharacterized protein
VPSVCWRRIDQPGHEVGGFGPLLGGGWRLTGSIAMAFRGEPCALRYGVILDDQWRTVGGMVAGGVGDRQHEILVKVVDGQWFIGDTEYPDVRGCVDLDLNFSPITNLLPIRRLEIPVGGEVKVTAAWLRFPEMVLQPLEQVYRRTSARTFQYESAGGAFRAELEVNEHGLVTTYGDIWSAEAFEDD